MPKQKTDNRSVGTRFEAELCEILAQHGFWAHNMQQNSAGQPADIIAVRGAFHTLIDCKHVADDKGFPFSEIRENQRSAMKMFQKKCHEFCYFAFKLSDDTIWLITLERMDTLAGRGKTRLTDDEIRGGQAWSLEAWLDSSKTWAEDT